MIADDVRFGREVKVYQPDLVNLYGCQIGDETKIGAFVEIRKTVRIGSRCKIQAFVFIPEGVVIGDGVFVGPHVCFTNDLFPRSTNSNGELLDAEDWAIVQTRVEDGASIGANSTILCGLTVGAHSMIGAGAVVTRDVAAYAMVQGNPARQVGDVRERVCS